MKWSAAKDVDDRTGRFRAQPVILTVIGWGQIIKAAVNFVAPRLAMRGLARVAIERAWEFQVAGALFIGLSGLMAYLVART